MSYKIEKTETEKEIINFKAEYLQDCFNNGYILTFAEDNNFIYALERYEELQDGVVIDLSQTPEYIAKQLETARANKLVELMQKLNDKSTNVLSTLTVNLPATLQKGEEIKQVTEYKLLIVTSGGDIRSVLSDLKDVPPALLPDTVVTADGYIIKGLNQDTTMNEMTKSQVYFIWLAIIQVQAKLTEYLRLTKEQILTCANIDELNAIIIDFEKF